MATLSNQLSPMTEIVLTSPTNTLTQAMVSTPNAIYIIKNVFNLNGATIEIPSNCTLSFEGGALSNGTVKGNQTFIKALRYQIFDIAAGSQLILTGTFSNDYLSAHWFGAKGDGVTDDAPAINSALANSCKCTIELDRLNYLINSTIYISAYDGMSFKCAGTISTNSDIVMIDISTHYNEIYVYELKYNNPNHWEDDYHDFKGTGVLLSENVYHCTVNIEYMWYLNKGLSFVPFIRNPKICDYAGSQYNKFTFQTIDAVYCIYINLLSGNDNGNNLWMNENQFFGGRVRGKYGVYVERLDPMKGEPKFDWINGNVFYCIGFEAIETPVYMYHSMTNDFNNVRMSESIETAGEKSETYIDLLDCNNLTFNIKSFLPYSVIKAEKCCQINLERCFSDQGLLMGYDRMALTNSGFPNVTEMSTTGRDLKYISRADSPLNVLKKLFYNNAYPPVGSVNFNELFVTTWDDADVSVFSNICEITVYNNVNIDIDFKDSLYKLRPDLTIRYEHHGNSKMSFYKDYQSDVENDIPPVAVLNKRGTYKFTTDYDYNISIIPICIDAIQD